MIKKFIANDEYDYIYDPEHKKHPAGYRKTRNGWVKGKRVPQEETSERTIDTTTPSKEQSFKIHESQLSDDDTIIVVENGKNVSKKYGDMSEDEKQSIKKQLNLIGSFSQKGFSDYTNVSLDTFNSNMKKSLALVENDKIVLGTNDSNEPVKKNVDKFKKKLVENLNRVVDKYSPAIKSRAAEKAINTYTKVLSKVIDKAVKDSSISDITEKNLDAFLQEDMKRLIYQEMETRRRSMGDHGIRHLVSNAINTVKIMNQLSKGGIKKGTTGKDMLAGMICQVNHDIGYTLGSVAVSGKDGTFHKTHSGTIASQERDRYKNLLGEEYADKLVGKHEVYPEDGKTPVLYYDKQPLPFEEAKNLKSTDEKYMRCKTKHQNGYKGAIQFHDDTEYDWKNNAFHASIALSDCTSLFGKDKVQEFFLEDNDAMEAATKMQMILTSKDFTYEDKSKAFKGFKNKMIQHIKKMPVSTLDKQMLEQQVNEITIKDEEGKGFDTINDILTRSCGVLKGYEYNPDKNVMIVNTSYSQDGKILEDMFGNKLARSQWEKMTKNDLNLSEIDVDNDGNQKAVYGNKNNPDDSRIVVNIKDMGNAPLINAGVQKAYRNMSPRLALQQLARLGQATGENGKVLLKEKVNEYNKVDQGKQSKGEILFGKVNWEKIKKLLADGKYDELKDVEMSETEKAYLMSEFKTASKTACRIAYKVLNNYYKQHRIATMIAKDDTIRHYKYEIADVLFRYSTDGKIRMFFDNHGYQTVLSEPVSLERFQELVDKYEDDVLNNPKLFMKKSKLQWKKRF